MNQKSTPSTILLGSHTSSAGGLNSVFQRAESIGSTVLQMFVKNNRTWNAKPLSDKDINSFKEAWQASSIKEVVAHSTYLINIGSKNKDTADKSTKALANEIARCEQLGIKYLVLHPGSHLGAGEDTCIKQIASNLDLVLEHSSGYTEILLETMAGQGTNIGYSFEHLAKIISLSSNNKKLGICLDTCHIFSAGYDISSQESYEKTIIKFNSILGLERLKVIHLNDSKTKCNSRKDRHEALGQGTIPLKIFSLIIQDNRFDAIPKILETPSDDKMQLYKKEIEMLKSFLQ